MSVYFAPSVTDVAPQNAHLRQLVMSSYLGQLALVATLVSY